MDTQMLITYAVAVLTGAYGIASIIYFSKNKRFLGRSPISTIAAIIVCFMAIYAIYKGVSISQMQYLIERGQ